MRELQAKAKVTQTMTRDGLMVENQADGTVENVSSREAEQDYSTDSEGKAEKILERAEDIKDGHKNKKKAKKAAETAATAKSEDGLHRSAARLELTEEERADPALQPYIQKAGAKADKLDAARAALPKKRVPVKEKVYDAASGKAKSTLRFEQQDKGPPSLKPNPASRPLSEALLFAHGKIHEVEHENVGVEGGHKGEELVEHQTAKAIRSSIRHHKMKPYKAVEKAERQLMSANAEYFYQKSLRDNPQIAQSASNPISRMWQKQRIKQQYAKAARQAGQAAAQGAAATAENGFRVTKLAAEGGERVAEFAARNWKTILIVAVFGLLALLLITGLQSCTVMAGTAGTGVTASSYFSKDKDMLGAEKAYAKLEQKLQRYLDTYEATHNYDEYHFYLDEIEHDPYVLISILSALHDGVFTLAEVQGELEMLFEKQYILTATVTMQIRYRTKMILIDRANEDKETSVHFLNQVDDADLLALLDEEPQAAEVCTCTVKCDVGDANENCPLCEKSLRNCTAPEAVKTDTETPQEKPKSNMGSLMILLVLALAGGGAALYYFKFRKPKTDTTGHDDLDEYDFGEDEDADEEPAEIEIHSEDGQEDET